MAGAISAIIFTYESPFFIAKAVDLNLGIGKCRIGKLLQRRRMAS
jgi:hypothetical protein